MDESARYLHSPMEHDEDDVVSALSMASISRRTAPTPSPTSATLKGPFSPILYRHSGYSRMSSDSFQEMADLDTRYSQESDDELPVSALTPRQSPMQSPVVSQIISPQSPQPHHVPARPDLSIATATGMEPVPDQPRQVSYSNEGGDVSSQTRTRPQPKGGVFSEVWETSLPETKQAYRGATPEPGAFRTNTGSSSGSVKFSHVRQSDSGDLGAREDSIDDEYDDETFYKKFAEPPTQCSSKGDIRQRRMSWLSITIFVLAIYSTVMSGIWLVVSIVQPRWGHGISSKHGLLPSNATLVAALVAKTIEMSFVTVFISCLGQILTRRAFIRKSGGMTLAEMTMRNWVIQPGSLITHFETLPYAAMTVLGALSLTATLAASFYTTASDAMVAPKLKYGDWEHKELSGYIRSSYANAKFVSTTCPSLLDENDQAHSDESCVNVQFSGQSYRNLLGFMTTWSAMQNNGTRVLEDMDERPPGTALLYDNVTMTSTWIEKEHSDVRDNFNKTGRIINNVTLALPHPGVYAAAMLPQNGILQPDDLAGVGEYAIRAGVVSPAINVMCVNMSPEELEPLVYTAWPNSINNETGIPNQVRGYYGWESEVPKSITEDGKPEWLNRTVVDDVFEWGPDYERRPPVFQLYPADYNILTNGSVTESDSIYLLGKTFGFANYTLCQMRSWVSPNCSTQFNISGTAGASLTAHCEDPEDKDSYLRSLPPGQEWAKPAPDWRWLAEQWRMSMDLNGGALNVNASNARILTQLALKEPSLSLDVPSMAEALAVYAGALEVIGSIGTPYRHYWETPLPDNIAEEPGILQAFNASLITQEYTSGHVNAWQGIFYVILGFVFAINLFCLAYLAMRSRLVTDFTEPQNIFALAINSPPSTQLNGSCGGGPEKRELVVPWRLGYVAGTNHYFFEEANDTPWRGKYKTQSVSTAPDYGEARGESYKRLSASRGWL